MNSSRQSKYSCYSNGSPFQLKAIAVGWFRAYNKWVTISAYKQVGGDAINNWIIFRTTHCALYNKMYYFHCLTNETWRWTLHVLSYVFVCFMVFNATFNNISGISWRSVLLVKETGGPGENHLPVTSHWQTLSHNVVHLALIEIQTRNTSDDRHWL